jgi:hypothetical protein
MEVYGHSKPLKQKKVATMPLGTTGHFAIETGKVSCFETMIAATHSISIRKGQNRTRYFWVHWFIQLSRAQLQP